MAQITSDNIITTAPKPLDDKWGKFDEVNEIWLGFEDLNDFFSSFDPEALFPTMTFYVKSIVNPLRCDLYALDTELEPYRILEGLALPERINFTDATGLIEIDFSINDRVELYPTPQTRAYQSDGKRILGYSEQINTDLDVIQSMELDGIFDDGYILLSN